MANVLAIQSPRPGVTRTAAFVVRACSHLAGLSWIYREHGGKHPLRCVCVCVVCVWCACACVLSCVCVCVVCVWCTCVCVCVIVCVSVLCVCGVRVRSLSLSLPLSLFLYLSLSPSLPLSISKLPAKFDCLYGWFKLPLKMEKFGIFPSLKAIKCRLRHRLSSFFKGMLKAMLRRFNL